MNTVALENNLARYERDEKKGYILAQNIHKQAMKVIIPLAKVELFLKTDNGSLPSWPGVQCNNNTSYKTSHFKEKHLNRNYFLNSPAHLPIYQLTPHKISGVYCSVSTNNKKCIRNFASKNANFKIRPCNNIPPSPAGRWGQPQKHLELGRGKPCRWVCLRWEKGQG